MSAFCSWAKFWRVWNPLPQSIIRLRLRFFSALQGRLERSKFVRAHAGEGRAAVRHGVTHSGYCSIFDFVIQVVVGLQRRNSTKSGGRCVFDYDVVFKTCGENRFAATSKKKTRLAAQQLDRDKL